MATTTPQLASLQRRLADLNTYQLPRLRECTGPIGLHNELADELRLDLAGIRTGLEIAKEEVELIQGYEEREGGWRVYEAVERDYKRARLEYRSALLYSKKRISTTKNPIPSSTPDVSEKRSARDERYELQTDRLGSSSTLEPSNQSNTRYPPRSADFGNAGEDAVQTKTNEVTDALRRTLGTMQVELEKSVLSVQMLEDSTKTLRSTSGLYDTYASLLNTSTHLVKALERADWWDRLVIALAFLLFLLTVGWVIKRRVFDKVVGGVGWWVGGSARLVKMGFGLGGSKDKAGKAVEGAARAKGAVKKITEVGKVAAKKGKVAKAVADKGTATLSGIIASASTLATAAASSLGSISAKVGQGEVETIATLSIADSVVAPSPPPSVSAISPPVPPNHNEL